MTFYDNLQKRLRRHPRTWLVTGAAGFIGAHLVEKLLLLNQRVIGLDNFSTGQKQNLTDVRKAVGPISWKSFKFIEGDIRETKICRRSCEGADYVLHHAAACSVPLSLTDPLTTNECNVTGFLNVALAARDAKVRRFVYASSSSVYGDEPTLPKLEDNVGHPLSPYALTKRIDELYADVLTRCYDFEFAGLRYFNVFGPRQDPNGPYAAVIPKWIAAMRKGEPIYINGDGETSRDFCYIENVVQANLLAAASKNPAAKNENYNIACNERTTLNELFTVLREGLLPQYPHLLRFKAKYKNFRPGDVRHSQADIQKAERLLGYVPSHRFAEGIAATLRWHSEGRPE
ncbi:MAG TPA: SDR family oxidoreductase [Verrucomicrobiae bacterium]|nr:SDR family oxidoreductase [Verrucomicrobiae bacterium]